MTTYPAGAGPYSAQYGGEVYVPPAAGVTTPDTLTTTGGTRPSILSQPAYADAQGRVVAVFTAPTTQAWLVRRIVVTSDTPGKALVYVGTLDPSNLVSGTVAATFDENDANQPYLVPEGQSMTVHFLSGGTASARIEYDVI